MVCGVGVGGTIETLANATQPIKKQADLYAIGTDLFINQAEKCFIMVSLKSTSKLQDMVPWPKIMYTIVFKNT